MRRVVTNSMVFSRLLAFFAILIGLLVGAGGVSYAQTAESLDRLFTIRSIKVDVTANRASVARRTALAQAESEAYDKLLLKITQPEDRVKLPELSAQQKQRMISGIQVVEEQSSSRRYIALLDVRFEPGIVSRFLAEHHVPHVLGTGGGLIVLHAHTDGVTQYLWQPKGATQLAHRAVDWLNRIRNYVFPRGELSERALVSYSEVANLASDNLRSLARRYDVASSLLISSKWKDRGDNTGSLSYNFYSTDGDFTGDGSIIGNGATAESEAQRLMFEKILEEIDSAWRDRLLVDTGTGGELIVLIPTTTFDVLPNIEQRLKDVTLVNEFKIRSLGLPFSEVFFRYTGREDQLVMALRYAGLDLTDYGDSRILKLRTED